MTLLPVRRKEPAGPLARPHEQADNLFRSFSGDWETPLHWPAVDVVENEFVVKAEVPECKAEDIDIFVRDARPQIVCFGPKQGLYARFQKNIVKRLKISKIILTCTMEPIDFCFNVVSRGLTSGGWGKRYHACFGTCRRQLPIVYQEAKACRT